MHGGFWTKIEPEAGRKTAIFRPAFLSGHSYSKVFEQYMGKTQGQQTKNWLAFYVL